MRRAKKKGIFAVVLIYSVLICVLSAAATVGYGIFFSGADTSLGEVNNRQKSEFDSYTMVLDGVNAQFAARFEPLREEALKINLARQGFTALLDQAQVGILYGYDDIERILTNQTVEIREAASAVPENYNWPAIKLVSMVYDASTCTTMIELNGGENSGEQQRQVWKWQRRDGKWVPLVFSSYYTASDVEISQRGISFLMAPRHNATISKLFVLNK